MSGELEELRQLVADLERYEAIDDREERASWARCIAIEVRAVGRRLWNANVPAGQEMP